MKQWLLLLFIFISFYGFSQKLYRANHRFLEAGLYLGGANYTGDVSSPGFVLAESHLSYGAYLRYFLTEHFSMRAQVFAGAISGDDAHAPGEAKRARSLRFGTDIFETALLGEWHPLGLYRYKDIGVRRFFISPYLFIGAAGTFGGAKVEYYGLPADESKVLSAPLPETGPNQKFLATPFGIGCRAQINETIILGLDGGARLVFSDTLDGVHLNGNPDNNDWYYFGGMSISFILSSAKKRW
ncbi:MAG: hypothetical protein JNN28_10120 [Saprospiraceae bacterium]|nr:hypothetical protein [Saprospiraceae bacterium]